MSDQYLITGTNSPATDWTSEVILEKDGEGKPKKVISTTQPAELSKDNKDALESLGIKFEKASKDDIEEAQEKQVVGSDAIAAAPLLGASATDQGDSKSSKS